MRRVVITGIGAVTPVGNSAPETWAAFVAGKPGVERITLFDPSPYGVQHAGEVKNFDNSGINPKELRHMDRSVQFAIVTSSEALKDSSYEVTLENTDRTGVVIGTAAGGIGTLLANQKILEERGPRRLGPQFIANFLPDSASGQIAIAFNVRGPNMGIASACATGGHAIGEAFELIRRDDADVVIAGGTETVILPIIVAGFVAMRGLAENEDPHKACRPFDKNRNGFVLAEGCVTMVLEELEHAQQRGAHIYAEVVGYGSSNDAFDMVGQREGGEAAARSMNMALRKARIEPDQVGYICAHGTGTQLNDKAETQAIKKVFGDHAYDLVVSSFKGMTGHMMGASGAAGVLATTMALHSGVISPTINYETLDPECDLDYNTNGSRELRVEYALSNAIGLGGHNSSVLVRRYTA